MSAPVVFLSACSADLGDVRAFLGEAIDASGAKALFQEYSLPVVSGSPREMIETVIPRADVIIHLAGIASGGEPGIAPWPGFRCTFTQYEYYLARSLGKKVYTFLCAESGFEYRSLSGDPDPEGLQRRHRERLAMLDFTDVPWPGEAPCEHPMRYDIAGVSDLWRLLGGIIRELPFSDEIKARLSAELERPWFPPAKPPQFTAREDELENLAGFLRERPRICVHGPGGVGKTALSAAALERVAPSRTQPGPFTGGIYSHDFYLAPTLEQALGSVLIQAGKGDLPEDQRPDAVRALLARPGVALYLEGCERTQHLDVLLALAPGCRVLYTTRHPPHDPHHAAVEVKPFGSGDAVRVLQSYARSALCDDLPLENLAPAASEDWGKLAAPFGGLALALELAGHHLGLQKISPRELLASLSQRGLEAIDHAPAPDPAHPTKTRNLGVLFSHCLDALAAPGAPVFGLLHVLALGGIAPVPQSLLPAQTGLGAEEIERGLESLHHHHLIGFTRLPAPGGEGTERAAHLAHALLADWCRENLDRWGVDLEESRRIWIDAWKDLLRRAFTDARMIGGWQSYEALIPIFDVLLREIETAEGGETQDLVGTLTLVAATHNNRGRQGPAIACQRRALEITKRILGSEHPDTLMSLSNLGAFLKENGDLVGAEPLLRHALEARERIFGSVHPETLSSLNNLASLYAQKGDLEAAQTLSQRALEARERLRGPDHPSTLFSLNNLAHVLHQKGDFNAAESLYRRALESRCARKARLNAGGSPAGAIRRFSTADRANCVAARRGGEQAWSRTGRSQ